MTDGAFAVMPSHPMAVPHVPSIRAEASIGSEHEAPPALPAFENANSMKTKGGDDLKEEAEDLSSLRTASKEEESHEDHGADHGHGHGSHSLVNAIAAAFITYLLMVGLCCGNRIIMFYDSYLARHRALGVTM
eukprot:TRINITY_DN58526_c0_g1_i1.p1 TRINITY_DN58526_c0_g1~~TRINITY_DN58526_c0_g1_i1.p1  ORF type:complete len:133 (+),score=17.65 TRINITY_DN58526_c0_g1_i1:218-616(+)